MADRVKVGNAEVAMVWDAEFRYTPSQFLASMPAEKWAPYLNGVSPDEIQESRVMTFLIRSQGKNILVDAGVGAHGLWRFGEGHLLDSLKALDVAPEDIDFVVPTHLHLDHVGWFTRSTPNGPVPTFRKARYLIQKEDWEFFVEKDYFANRPDSPLNTMSQKMFETAVIPMKDTGLMDLIGPERIITDGVTILHTPGHTLGSVSILVQSGSEAALLIGDAAHTPAQMTEVEYSPGIDIDPSLSERSRRAIIAAAQEKNAYVAGAHFGAPGHPAFGRIILMDGRPMWRGVSL
jgi:glyoxylase-like metal-dependent hydrolase (beta-lactamase superfamily II)